MPSARTFAVAIMLAMAGLGTWLIVTNDDPRATPTSASPPPATAAAIPARLVTPDELSGLAADLGYPTYWLGERPGQQLEWTLRPDGAAIVRYLPGGATPGDPGTFLSVASYPLANATDVVDQGGQRPGALSDVLPGDARTTTASAEATNAYFAAPDEKVLVEVYTPDPGKAYSLIRSGQLVMVPGP